MSASQEASDSIQNLKKLSEFSISIYKLDIENRGTLISRICQHIFQKAETKQEKLQLLRLTTLLQNSTLSAEPPQRMSPTSSSTEEPSDYNHKYIEFLKESGELAQIIISFQPDHQPILNDLINYLISQVAAELVSPHVRKENEKFLSLAHFASQFLN